jgi:hypothetical protein
LQYNPVHSCSVRLIWDFQHSGTCYISHFILVEYCGLGRLSEFQYSVTYVVIFPI